MNLTDPGANNPVCHFGTELAEDPDGRLFDLRFRQMVRSEGPEVQAVEALSAVRAASRGLKTLMDRWADEQGLSEGRLQVIMRLHRSDGGQRSLGELAEALGVSPRNITGLVDHLERDGLVQRVPDPDDRRSILARLTPAGRQRVEGLWERVFRQQMPLLDEFTQDELVQLRHLALKLVQRIGRIPAGAPKEVQV